ncbi:mechanosensitive ion channel family protein [Pontibacter anaerobius]|uniref:Mechanosensitive ion channel family protein n=1 Tax=Pontibacter anaerobius TaxID=2993940 RepID=A0ABT3REY2_9BACT|nr:mechanosensitive ion channel family protein [Pontibacter anaerobius]MCX2740001.1 mechanosensitive ion channel family protein [Pontibacter anaerobius]
MQDKTTDKINESASGLASVVEMYWERFLVMLPSLLLAIAILVLTLWLAGRAKYLIGRKLSGKSKDEITVKYIARISKWVLVLIGFLLMLQTLGLSGMAGGILASAGVSVVVLGFAFRDIAENFLAGLILAFNRPFEEGDFIEVNELMGKVITLNIRTTHLFTFDSRDIYVPNGKILTSAVINFTHNGFVRLNFLVHIDYHNNIQEAILLIEKTVTGVEGVLPKYAPFAAVEELGASAVSLKVFFWAESADFDRVVHQLRGNVMQAVTRALLENGFTIPANIQELKLYDFQKDFPVRIVGSSTSSEKL